MGSWACLGVGFSAEWSRDVRVTRLRSLVSVICLTWQHSLSGTVLPHGPQKLPNSW